MKKETVLILDDNQDALTSMIALLGNHLPDVEVCTFLKPDEKFYKKSTEVNLIIIDIRLNGETGIEVAHKICALGTNPIFLFISGYEINDKMFEPFNECCLHDFIPKPCSNSIFANRVNILLRAATVYKSQQIELERERHLQEEITANMVEGVYLVRVEDGIIMYANDRFEKMFGYEPGEMIDQPVSIVNAPTTRTPQETVDFIINILKDTGEWKGEIQNIKKDGTTFWCEASASIFDHHEYGQTIVSVHTDIEEYKRIIQSFWNVFNYMNFIVVILDSDMNIHLGNYYLAQLLGFESENDLIGRRWMDFISESEQKVIQYIYDEVLENTTDFYEHINDIVSLTGEQIPVRWFNAKINHETKGSFSIGIPITKKVDEEATVDSLRAYWRDIINKDKTTIQAMKKVFADQLKA